MTTLTQFSLSFPARLIHSVADIITNSSTEVFIMANGTTIANVKALVNGLFKLGGSSLTCDEVFTIEYDFDRYTKDYLDCLYDDYCEENYWNADAKAENSPEYNAWKNERVEKEREAFMQDDWSYDGSSYRDRYIKVTTKDDSQQAAECAKMLSELHALFELEGAANY